VLTIERIGSTAVGYYTNLGRDAHEYFSDETNRPGRWFGEGASELGLVGDVTEKVFGNLLRGLSIDGTETWVKGPTDPKRQRRAGVDCSIHLSKSASAYWSQGDARTRSKLMEAAERAVDKTLATLTEFCGGARRGHLGLKQEKAKLVAAIFQHDTARPIPGSAPDPHIHFHCVFVNMAIRPDGSIGAWDARRLFRGGMKHTLGALFRAEFSRELRELGIGTHRPEKEEKPREKAWWFELDAVPKSLCDEMSKRRKAVEKWMRQRGLTGTKAAQLATLETREKKQAFSQQELDQAWSELGRQHGFGQVEVQQAFEVFDPVDQEAQARASLERAVAKLTKERARFSDLELLRFTAEEAQSTGSGIQAVREVVDQVLEHSPDVVRLKNVKGERQWTTREMLEVEARMLAAASRLNKKSSHTLSYEELSQVANNFPTLRTEQRACLARMCVGQNIACVNGISGSGKTFMLSVARAAWQSKGFDVIGTTLAANASQVLHDESGIRAIHIHKLLHAIQRGEEKLDSNTVLVVDEAGMVGTRLLEQLTGLVGSFGAKLVLVGDHTQLSAIDAGAPFRVIAEREGVTELLDIVRQKEAWQQRLVKNLRAGRSATALKTLANRGLLYVGDDPEEAMQRLASDWSKRAIGEGELLGSVMLAGKNADCRELNHLAQAMRRQAGQLGFEKLQVGDYEFRIGDIVVANRNNRPLLVQNGMKGTVTGIDGDTLRVRFHGGYQVDIDTTEYKNISLGYCLSVHKAQGLSTEYTFLLMDQAMTDREQAYVGGSRFKGEAKFYADVLSGGEELSWLMERSRGKDLAHEHLRQHDREVA